MTIIFQESVVEGCCLAVKMKSGEEWRKCLETETVCRLCRTWYLLSVFLKSYGFDLIMRLITSQKWRKY